jgi:phosphoribosylformylglycinamidine cyclo-ligase
MKRNKVIDNANIPLGDVIVGLASFGQATYEKSYNGGMGLSERFICVMMFFAGVFSRNIQSFDAAVPEINLFRTSYQIN